MTPVSRVTSVTALVDKLSSRTSSRFLALGRSLALGAVVGAVMFILGRWRALDAAEQAITYDVMYRALGRGAIWGLATGSILWLTDRWRVRGKGFGYYASWMLAWSIGGMVVVAGDLLGPQPFQAFFAATALGVICGGATAWSLRNRNTVVREDAEIPHRSAP